ncbi:hypothetical protein SF1_28860 [Sphingobacterium faecium NBRC 15299]|uniref:DUF4180 domain-containing protein n=1 Tax=Sphingobacterium faecium TaxID=34087 RepID=UPI000D3713C3|nr:DUF4180 domain-containing protein [Sphingobacterium faecium]MQP27334.1 DUF4180 domain-containing protein [Sphingobacterium faecium]PTX13907.1 uncharacterized protein DUF4180 [Sphingobacterium faecium]GEM64904.1 hypothetical protein SF1_28860 [Sphingobacterium faecium NBRC 15299]
MNINIHHVTGNKVAEVTSENTIMKNLEDALELIGNLYYQDISKVIVYEKNLIPDFFDLQNKFAGDVLQKFSNYRIQLIFIGDFSKYNSRSMSGFIFESNKGKQINFVKTRDEAFSIL